MLTKVTTILESLDSLNNIDQIRKDIRNIPRHDEYFDEGWKEVWGAMKKAGKYVLNKIKAGKYKKNLANLRRMEHEIYNLKPDKNKVVQGTLATLGYKFDNVNESVSENESDDTDSFFCEGLERDQVEKFAERFAKQKNIRFRVLPDGSNIMGAMSARGGFAVLTLTDQQTTELFSPDGHIITQPISNTGPNKIIVIAPEDLPYLKFLNNQDDFNTIMMHEYGHVMTLDGVTTADWADYVYKQAILNDIAPKWDSNNVIAITGRIYHAFTIEDIANKYAGTKPEDLIRILAGTPNVPNNWNSHTISNVLQIKLPADMVSIVTKGFIHAQPLDKNDMLKITDYDISIYPKLLPPHAIQNTIVDLKDRRDQIASS